MPARKRTTKDVAVRARQAAKPDQVRLGEVQASRLAQLSGLAVEDVAGRTVAQLREDHEWVTNPEWWAFRRVCGRVVKRDPITGDDWGVPGATVHVYDTDCSYFGYFPSGWSYGWLWPFRSHREEIASTVTDACGNFCVWVPRFDIDWVLRWRQERQCYLDLFRRPSIGDLVERLREVVEVPPHIGPWPPDPGPERLDFLNIGIDSANVLGHAVGARSAARLQPTLRKAIGDRSVTASVLQERAFVGEVPPPAMEHLDDQLVEHLRGLDPKDHPHLRDLRAGKARVPAASWLGPFLRCRNVFVPEFVPIVDVPDITFGVTQDVDNDGDEETIYAEGHFDVRWNAGPIPPVVLHASPEAFATPTCADRPDLGACAAPEIVVVGHMPLHNPPAAGTFPFVDTATGYAVRPNRAHPSGRTDEVASAAADATAPLAGLLEFWGCNHRTANGQVADRYRILARTSSDDGATWGPSVPIVDTWMNWRVVGNPSILEWKQMTQLPGGWWEVLDANDQWMPGDHYLLQWHGAPDGLIEMQLELGKVVGAAVNVIGSAAPVRIRVDNSRPHVEFTTLAWRPGSSGSWIPLPLNCPTIHRGGQDIQIQVGVSAWATHLQSVWVGASGCGGGSPVLTSGFEDVESFPGPISVRPGYWHKSHNDNNVLHTMVYDVPNSLSPGAYSLNAVAYSRAFSPGDGHVYDPAQADTSYNPAPIWTNPSIGIAIVD